MESIENFHFQENALFWRQFLLLVILRCGIMRFRAKINDIGLFIRTYAIQPIWSQNNS